MRRTCETDDGTPRVAIFWVREASSVIADDDSCFNASGPITRYVPTEEDESGSVFENQGAWITTDCAHVFRPGHAIDFLLPRPWHDPWHLLSPRAIRRFRNENRHIVGRDSTC